MLSLRTDTYSLNKNGNAQHELFADISTRRQNSITVGESAGKISKGTGNAFVGFESGKQNFEGSFGVFVGFQAGSFNQNGNWNTYVGAYAGQRNNRGSNNTFIGFNAGQSNADGSECTAIGVNAMRENSVGNRNVAVGMSAGERILEGDDNTMVGSEAGQNIRSGNLNTMTGFRAGRGAFRGNENTYFGAYSGYCNADGNANALIGYRSGEFLTEGGYNVAVGAYTMQNSTDGSSNIAIGAFAGTNVSGTGNVLLGTDVASGNSLGNDNTIIGKSAGRNTLGDENVIIGTGAGEYLMGGCNVVIGSEALSTLPNATSGSVVIGYNAATARYRSGSNNIFIGIGADTTISSTSHAIAIGSAQTLASENSISIGESIQNSGERSVVLGYQLYSDSDNCVSLGNNIFINSVNVFNDPLNSIFPVNCNQEYESFNLLEEYTDTLSTGINEAVASITTCNIYDSGSNPFRVPIKSTNINLLDLFDHTIEYYPISIQQTPTLSIEMTFSNYIVSCNLITTDVNIPPTEPLIIDITTNVQELIIPFDTSLTGSVAYNLIPASDTSLTYTISVARRILLDYIDPSPSPAPFTLELGQSTLLIPANLPVLSETSPPEAIGKLEGIVYLNRYLISTLPQYGVFNLNISDSSERTYTRFIESLYAPADTFSMIIANRISSYTILPESNLTKTDTITFTNSNLTYTNPTIYISPESPTIIDRSYLNIITPVDNLTITVLAADSNISLTDLQTDSVILPSTSAILDYSDFQIALSATSQLTETMDIQVGNEATPTSFTCVYKDVINLPNNPLQTCNISIPSFSISSTPTVPYYDNTYVIEQPEYGIVSMGGTYTPYIFNLNDSFTLLTDNNFLKVNISVDASFNALTLNKMQEPETLESTTTLSSNIVAQAESRNITLVYNFTCNVIRDGLPQATTTGQETLIYTDDYTNTTTVFNTEFNGYPYTCNVVYRLTFNERLTNEDFTGIDTSEFTNTDFVVYNTYNLTITVQNKDSTVSVSSNIDMVIPPYYTSNNENKGNRFYRLDYSESNTKIYDFSCNITEQFNIVEEIQSDTYYDLYGTRIYNTTTTTPIEETSNVFSLLPDTPSPPTYSYTQHDSVSRTTDVNHTIPTIQLTNQLVYEQDGTYTLSPLNPPNLQILQKDTGYVNTFHQSNIQNREIHIYNTESVFVPITSNLIFENDKIVQINYFQNSTLTTSPIPEITIYFENGVHTNTAFQLDTNMAITHLCNVAFPTLQYSAGTTTLEPFLIDTTIYEETFIEYILYDTSNVYKPIRQHVNVDRYLLTKPLFINAGISAPKKFIRPKDLTFIDKATSNVVCSFASASANSFTLYNNDAPIIAENNVISFTQEDVNSNLIRIDAAGVIQFEVITPNFKTESGVNIAIDKPISINKFLKNYFPAREDITETTLINLHTNSVYTKTIQGSIWNIIDKDPALVFIYISTPPANGFLYLSDYTITNRISYADLQNSNNVFHYVPYIPMNIVNDSLEFFLEYAGAISPKYTMTLKNYWSKWGEIVLSDGVPLSVSELPRSAGMIDDGITWTLTTADTVELVYQAGAAAAAVSETISISREPFTKRPALTSLTTTLTGSLANYVYLDALLESHTLNGEQDVVFYIISPPQKGLILNGASLAAVSYFTSQDIIAKNVFYQNFGGTVETTDFFEIKVASSPYDISIDLHRVDINIVLNVNIITNVRDYIYYDTISEGLSTYNNLTSNALSLSRGDVYVYEQNNIELYIRDGESYNPTITFTQTDIEAGLVYYRPTPEFFSLGYNKNEPLSFKFLVNDTTEPNKLSIIPIYQEIYTQEWFAKYNTYESSNVIEPTSQDINSTQIISYTAIGTGPEFADKKSTFEFNHRVSFPELEAFPLSFSREIQLYNYAYEIIDQNDDIILKVAFTKDKVIAFDNNNTIIVDIDKQTVNNSTSTLTVVNKDDTNDDKTSIYIDGSNILQGTTFDINENLRSFKLMRIVVPLSSNVQTGLTTIPVNDVNIYYDMHQYHPTIAFTNFKILVEANQEGLFSYNVVIGDQLKINGYNNICVGKNFATTGTGSIIIGNDIGSSPGSISSGNFLNEVFNSIIVSTSSFINTKVRDIIAVGNNILNNASSIDNIVAVDEFLAKKPVLIGNDIDVSKLDFHINFQNTFVKTNIANLPQIYCGLEEEPLCIGYTSNEGLSGEHYKLHVNGGICIKGASRQISGSIETKRDTFTISSPSSVIVLVLSWAANAPTGTTATVNVKFRLHGAGTGTGADYAYYNFEEWLSIDTGRLHIISTSTFATAGITGLEHTTVKNVDSSISIEIRWNTVLSLTGVMEVESVAPVSLGEIQFSVN